MCVCVCVSVCVCVCVYVVVCGGVIRGWMMDASICVIRLGEDRDKGAGDESMRMRIAGRLYW